MSVACWLRVPGQARLPARVTRIIRLRQENLSKEVRAIAWKAQLRLCARYRRLSSRGKTKQQIVTAIARELAAFMWAIAREVQLAGTQLAVADRTVRDAQMSPYI
jgi:hypothetical protein